MMDKAKIEKTFESLDMKGELQMGSSNYIVSSDGTISEATVWAQGGIWFIEHTEKDHEDWQRKYDQACNKYSNSYFEAKDGQN